jgi:flagellar protein FlbD
MIQLTRLNGNKFYVNCDLLKYAEASPDTVLTLLTGEKIVVRESCEDVVALGTSFRATVLGAAWPDAAVAIGVLLSKFALSPAPRGSQL